MRGDTVQIRLVGVNVDNRADGKGKAGLTFMTTTYVGESDTNVTDTNSSVGGYRDVRIRKDYNKGQYKNTISNDVYRYLTPVLKTQDNQADLEMDSDEHSATNNAIVEKVSMPSPLELNMNVTAAHHKNNYNGLTPAGTSQYNPQKSWIASYSYLYSGNAPYKYYQNNTSNVSEYCKLMRASGSLSSGGIACQNNSLGWGLWLRAANTSPYFGIFDIGSGSLSIYNAYQSEDNRVAVLLSF